MPDHMTPSEKRTAVAVSLTLLAGISTLIYGCLDTHGASAQVTGHRWRRLYNMEQLRTEVETSSSVPSGGRVLDKWTVFRTKTTRVGDKTVSKTYTETRYKYEIDRWRFARELVTEASNRDPHWPSLEGWNMGALVGQHRIGSQSETYWLAVKSDEYNGEVMARQDEWLKITDRDRLLLKINHFGRVMSFLTLEAE